MELYIDLGLNSFIFLENTGCVVDMLCSNLLEPSSASSMSSKVSSILWWLRPSRKGSMHSLVPSAWRWEEEVKGGH